MGKTRKGIGRTQLDPIPQTRMIEGMLFYLEASFINRSKAQATSKRLHKQGNWARVIEVQRGRRKYHAVYVKSGRKEKLKAEKRERRSETYAKIGKSMRSIKG